MEPKQERRKLAIIRKMINDVERACIPHTQRSGMPVQAEVMKRMARMLGPDRLQDTEELLGRDISTLGFYAEYPCPQKRQWTENALREEAKINTIGELISKSARELLCCRWIGRKTLMEIRRSLHEVGLELREQDPVLRRLTNKTIWERS